MLPCSSMIRCPGLCGRTRCRTLAVRPSFGIAAQCLQDIPVSVRVEHRVTVVQKPRRVDLDRSKDLDALSLSCHRNLRPAADPPPGRVEGRVLLKAGLLGKEETPLFCLGFF